MVDVVFCLHLQINMAIKTLSSDMTQLVSAMRQAQRHASTLLADDYRKAMLQAAHVLAFNSKNLIVAVDSGRKAAAAAAKTAAVTSQKSLPRHSTPTAVATAAAAAELTQSNTAEHSPPPPPAHAASADDTSAATTDVT